MPTNCQAGPVPPGDRCDAQRCHRQLGDSAGGRGSGDVGAQKITDMLCCFDMFSRYPKLDRPQTDVGG